MSDSDPVLAWLPMHVGDLMNRYKKGTDGKTPESEKDWKAVAKACYLLRGEVVLPDGR